MHYQMDILNFIRINTILSNNTYQHNNNGLLNYNHFQHLLMLQILIFQIAQSFETKFLCFEYNFLKFLPMQNMELRYLLQHTALYLVHVIKSVDLQLPDWFPHNYRKLIIPKEHVDYLEVFGLLMMQNHTSIYCKLN